MSGLAGAWRPGGAPPGGRVDAVLRALDDRGPDGREQVAVRGGTLAATLRAVAGEDPRPARDGAWTVCLDGLPGNLRPLRDELRARGRLVDPRPAAVVAAVFAEVGFARGLDRLEGDVAVVAHDAGADTLWLARDRSGLHPLAWAELPGGGLAWASSAAALARLPGLDPGPTPGLAARAVLLGFLPAPATAWRAVRALAAGERLAADARGVRVETYHPLAPNPSGAGGSAERWARAIGFAVDLAVRRRAEDAPAVALAGTEADPLLIALVAGRAEAPPLVLGFDDAGAALATASGARFLRVEAGPEALVAAAAERLATTGEPVLRPEAAAWWATGQRAFDAGVEAVITAEGASAALVAPPASRPARALGRLAPLARLPGRPRLDAEAWLRAWSHALPGEPLPPGIVPAAPAGDPDAAALWLARTFLLPDRDLAAAEPALAAHGIELRVPFADPRLLALLAEVPLEHLRAGGRPAALLHRAFADRPLPAAPPPPSLPVGTWYRGPLAGRLDPLPDRAAPLVDPDHVRALVRAHRAGEADHGRRLWALDHLAAWWDDAASPCADG